MSTKIIPGLDADPWWLEEDLYTDMQLGLMKDDVLMIVNHEYGFSMTPEDARRLAKRLNELADEAAGRRMRL